MARERTLGIIKPDAVSRNLIGKILARYEGAHLHIVAAKMLKLSEKQAKEFYAVHAKRPFYQELVNFMLTGPVLVLVLEGDNAVMKNRELMGATNPKEAAPGTIRADFAESIERNAVHGSDSPATAQTEITFFFKDSDLCPR